MRAYLDFNIVVSIHRKEILLADIALIDPEIVDFPFSASHIQEIDNITHQDTFTREEFINSHLETMSQISGGLYLYQQLDNEVLLLNESPFEVYKTINDVPFAKSAMKAFTEVVTKEGKQDTRNAIGISTKELNNSRPDEVIQQLNSVLPTIGFQGTFSDLIEKGIEFHAQGHTFGLSERFAATYELLDLFGYWKDKETQTSNFARLWDSNHAFFAAHCNYFISDDLRNRNKAKVAYNLFNIGTKVISSKGLE